MREQEWLACTDPDRLLSLLGARGTPDGPKLRLVACACVRQAWHLLTPQARAAVEVAESFAAGSASAEDLARARGGMDREPFWHLPAPQAVWAAWHATGEVRHRISDCLWNARVALTRTPGERGIKEAQAAAIRDIFGPLPFRPVAVDPRWLTPDVLAVARSIHAHRAFEDLPALGDALEEAGCGHQGLLDHLRGGGLHYLGCWALHLIQARP